VGGFRVGMRADSIINYLLQADDCAPQRLVEENIILRLSQLGTYFLSHMNKI